MSRSAADRVAIVTGASGGLGRAICQRLTADGMQVVGVDLVGADVIRADVAVAADNERVVRQTLERHGRIDVLVLNAGVQHAAPIAAFPEEEWDHLFGVLAKGPFLALRAAWVALTKRRGSSVVVIGSTSSFVAETGKSAYVAAKHAVVGLVKVAALEGAPYGLAVNAVAPGWMLTPLAERQLEARMAADGQTREQALEAMLVGQPVKRMVLPEEVAEVVAFLASGRAAAITGATVPVDLGALTV